MCDRNGFDEDNSQIHMIDNVPFETGKGLFATLRKLGKPLRDTSKSTKILYKFPPGRGRDSSVTM